MEEEESEGGAGEGEDDTAPPSPTCTAFFTPHSRHTPGLKA